MTHFTSVGLESFGKQFQNIRCLAEFHIFFHDVWYELEEVAQLRDECIKVRSRTNDKDALDGLNGLIVACDEAERHELGLFLGAD